MNKEKLGIKILENGYGIGIRHVQMTVMFLAMTALFIVRSSMSVAILAMTDSTRIDDSNTVIYDWDKTTQGLILSSFFWGYCVMQFPGAVLAKKFGGKPIVLVALISNSVICLLLPSLAKWGGWALVCGARVVMGLTQACLFPTTHTLLGRWFPAHEITFFAAIVYGGQPIGIIIALPLCGYIASSSLGWKSIFYGCSGLLFLISIFWFLLSASCPGEHRFITDHEKYYIEKALNVESGKKKPKVPWVRIFKCVPLWAIATAHMGFTFTSAVFFVDIATYLEKGLHISLQDSASFSAVPYVGMLIMSTLSTYVSEKLVNRGVLSLNVSRKLFSSIACVGSAVGLACLAFLGPENKNLALIALISSVSMGGFVSAGFSINHIDLSPNYGGIMLGITNCIATFASGFIPIGTSFILRNDPTDISRWHIVFLTIGTITLITNFVFVIFGSTEQQEWDDPNFDGKKQGDAEHLAPILVLKTFTNGK